MLFRTIWLYPNGDTLESNGFISLFIFYEHDAPEREFSFFQKKDKQVKMKKVALLFFIIYLFFDDLDTSPSYVHYPGCSPVIFFYFCVISLIRLGNETRIYQKAQILFWNCQLSRYPPEPSFRRYFIFIIPEPWSESHEVCFFLSFFFYYYLCHFSTLTPRFLFFFFAFAFWLWLFRLFLFSLLWFHYLHY